MYIKDISISNFKSLAPCKKFFLSKALFLCLFVRQTNCIFHTNSFKLHWCANSNTNKKHYLIVGGASPIVMTAAATDAPTVTPTVITVFVVWLSLV